MFYSKVSFAPALVLLLASCGGPAQAPREKAGAAAASIPVTTITVAPEDWAETFEASGTVRARTAAVISSRVMAYVQEVRVRAGDRVTAGQRLVVLDARDLESALRQTEAAVAEARSGIPEADSAIASAKAQLGLAQTTLGRMKDLLEKRSVSQQEFDEALAKVKVAEAGLQMASARRKQLDDKIRQAEQAVGSAKVFRGYSEILAPFAGLVTARKAEPGILATPGAPLLEMEQEGAYRLEAAVEESRLGSVRRGEKVTVRLDAVDKEMEGRVAEIVPAVEEASRAFTVKIDLPGHPGLRSGLFGRAEFALGKRKLITVPREAVVTQGQVQSVFVADSGVARSRLVSLGATRGGRLEVLAGLSEGDRLIHPRPAGLTDGARVEARP